MKTGMNDGKYIVLKRGGQILSLLFCGSRLISAHAEEERREESLLGNIYVARVKNVVKNIHAAFVEIAPGKNCFLDLQEAKAPVLINRCYDGRLMAEDEIIVQVCKEAAKNKPPAVTCALSLDGKYCVVTKGKPGIAYSAKLSAKTRICKEIWDYHPYKCKRTGYRPDASGPGNRRIVRASGIHIPNRYPPHLLFHTDAKASQIFTEAAGFSARLV